MLFNRALIFNAGQMPMPSMAGTPLLSNLDVVEKTTDANHTLTVAEMAGGCVYYSALSAGRTVTTPTAALILAAASDMNVGESFALIVSIQDAFAITWAAGTGVTLRGKGTTPASGSSIILVKKTGAATVDWIVL